MAKKRVAMRVAEGHNAARFVVGAMPEIDRLEEIENAPLDEAVFDIRADLPKELGQEGVEALYAKLSADYPDKKVRHIWQQQFQLSTGKPLELAPRTGKVEGGIFRSADDKQVVQCRNDGFTFSRLRPYTHWEELIPEVRRLWGIYTSVARPRRIKRIATRYINEITFPGASVKLEDYFTAHVPVPDGLPDEFGEFLQRVVLQFKAEGIRAIVTQSSVPSVPGKEPVARILFDIDVYKDGEFTEAGIWETFEELRRIKNLIFRKYLTEKAFKLFT